MQPEKAYYFALHAFASNMGVILKNCAYSIIYQRGISIAGGYKCGMYDGVPLMQPRSKKIEAYVDAIVSDMQGFIDSKQISKFMLYIWNKNVVERWIFDLALKEENEEMPSIGCVVPEMSELVLSITSIACCLPILKKKSRIFFAFEVASRNSDKSGDREDNDTITGHEGKNDYYVRCFPPDSLK